MPAVITVEVWSDVVCPWCYIGKRRFESALAALVTGPDPVDATIEVVYRAYQLDPSAPRGTSTPVREAYAKKFGGPERADAIIEHLTSTAAADGLHFRMDIAQRSNTVLAHRLLWMTAVDHGASMQHRLKERLLAAYFTEGHSVGDVDTLASLAAEVLPASVEAIVEFLESDRGKGEVNEELAMAAAHGITGVPTYVINGQWAIPGAQDPETFERVIRRAVERAAS